MAIATDPVATPTSRTGEPPPDGTASAFRPGDEVALRYITRAGSPGMSWPCRVVADREDLVALYIARGCTYMQWGRDEAGRRALCEAEWRRDVLRLMFPGAAHSIWLFWEAGEERTFSSYYVNMEEPFRRTPVGFDTNDHTLDIVVSPDRSWRWKDAEEFEERVRSGVFSKEFADAVRAEAEAVLKRLSENGSPFCDGWESWRPDNQWAPPALPPGWRTTAATLWERRHWAYLDWR